jgi:hypothetical protein
MSKQSKKHVAAQDATIVTEAPVTTDTQVTQEAPATAKKKAVRYAPVAILVPGATVTSVTNTKRPGTDSHELTQWLADNAVGKTVTEVEKAFVEAYPNKYTAHRVRRLLRWDFAHGIVQLGVPQPEGNAAE